MKLFPLFHHVICIIWKSWKVRAPQNFFSVGFTCCAAGGFVAAQNTTATYFCGIGWKLSPTFLKSPRLSVFRSRIISSVVAVSFVSIRNRDVCHGASGNNAAIYTIGCTDCREQKIQVGKCIPVKFIFRNWLFNIFNTFQNLTKSRGSIFGIATGYGLDDRGVRVRVPVRSRIFSSPRRPDRLCRQPNLLSNGYRELFSRLNTHLKLVPRSRKLGSIHPHHIRLDGIVLN
jgi:hypothetical protein